MSNRTEHLISPLTLAGLYTHVAYLAGRHPMGDAVPFSTDAGVKAAEETLVENLKADERFDTRAAAIVLTGENNIPELGQIRELKDLWVKQLDSALIEFFTASAVAVAA